MEGSMDAHVKELAVLLLRRSVGCLGEVINVECVDFSLMATAALRIATKVRVY